MAAGWAWSAMIAGAGIGNRRLEKEWLFTLVGLRGEGRKADSGRGVGTLS